MNKILNKVIAVLLTFILSCANLLTIGSYGITYALSDSELSEQNATTNHSNVEFNAYFEEEAHIKTAKISDVIKLFINIKVKNAGYLQNPQIMLQNVNFEISGDINNSYVQSVDKENNKILLKQLNVGSNITLEIPIKALNKNEVSIDNFSKDTKTILKGTYIDEKAKEHNISKEVINKLCWNGSAEATVEGQLTKYIPYNLGENYGVMLQAKVSSGILNNNLPVKQTKLTIEAPVINGKKPTSVNVVANNTKASNGKEDGLEFNNQNYTYDAETGILTIIVANLQNSISWIKNVKDEYLINFTFEDKEVYDYVNTNSLDTLSKVQAEIEAYNNEQTIVTKNTTIEMKKNEKMGSITDFAISASEYISKGQMYANYEASNKKETSYFVRYEADINNIKLLDNISFTQDKEELKVSTSTSTLSLQNSIYNKIIKINEKIFNKILGENGIIEIYNQNDNKIAIIDKNANKDGNGNYVVDISSKDEDIISIVTSKPVSEGKIIIEAQKAIKTNYNYSKQQLIQSSNLITKLHAKTNDSSAVKTLSIQLKEPQNVVELSINKTELSNTVENKNVEIRATLDTSNIDYSLYKNPTLKIKLPSCINKLKINSYDILMSNGLKIKELKAEKQNGAAVIYVELEGSQTEYTIGAEYKGSIIVISTDLTVKPLTPSKTEKIIMEYTNENTVISKEQNMVKGSASLQQATNNIVETQVKLVAPTEVMLSHGISNYKENTGKLSSTSEETIVATVDAYSTERIATIDGEIVNNNDNSIENIQILGRFPIQGNVNIDSNTELGSSFSMQVSSNITVTGIEASNYTVYYSENAQATKDLANTSNGWSTTRTQNVKSYLIVTNNYIMQSGKNIAFSYNAKIPADLKYNISTYEIYKVYYSNNSEIGKTEETKGSSKIQITTGKGPELTATITPTAELIREGQIVKMQLEVKNTGTIKVENVKVEVPLPENCIFVEFYIASFFGPEEGKLKTFTFESISPNETVTKTYYIKIKDNIEEIDTSADKKVNIINTARITADNIKGTIKSKECIIQAYEGLISISIISNINEERILQPNDKISYQLSLDNISGKEKIENINITIPLPNGTVCTRTEILEDSRNEDEIAKAVNYDKQKNILSINIDKVENFRKIEFDVLLLQNVSDISISAKAIINNDNSVVYYSNLSEYEVEKINLQISELTSTPEYVKEGEEIQYKFSIKNLGQAEVYGIRIQDTLPEGLTFKEIKYSFVNSDIELSNNFLINNNAEISIVAPLEYNETVNITIVAIADLLPNKNDKKIENQVTISGANFSEIITNKVTNYIEYSSELHDQNQGNSQSLNKITGTAWLDANKNGKREPEEKLLSNMDIVLINKKDNRIVNDIYTGEDKRVKTDNSGQYEIDNLTTGEYIVIFAYNSSMYSLTTYKAEGVNEQLNSNAIDIYITLDGERKLAGMSDIIKISGNNVRNINIGLYEAEKFDLKLDKYITKTTLTTPTIGTKVTTYNNKNIAKIEVLKENLEKSNVIIEYKIVVTNQGSVPGYAKKIVDYLPKGVSFYSELNKDWYLSENGNAYNSSLANTIINPGESKEVTLILSKIITENSLGTLNNTAEIYESYNELGLEDINSKAGNKIENENDMSKSDLILSLVTGNVVIYAGIGLVITIILAFGIIIIKKKVLNKK